MTGGRGVEGGVAVAGRGVVFDGAVSDTPTAASGNTDITTATCVTGDTAATICSSSNNSSIVITIGVVGVVVFILILRDCSGADEVLMMKRRCWLPHT
ncbi:hypothetical protein ACOMHN_028948 [Nucella lapillus]